MDGNHWCDIVALYTTPQRVASPIVIELEQLAMQNEILRLQMENERIRKQAA